MPGSPTTPGRPSTRITCSFVLPSGASTPSAPEISDFRGSMAGLHAPLPTLRRHPRGYLRTARADVVRYSFIVTDFHHLLLAGLPAH